MGGGDGRDGSGSGGGGGGGSPGGGEEDKAADMTTTTAAGLAAFERQFLGLFAAALPKSQAADPYHAIFAPSQQERAALPPLPMPTAPAVAPSHAANAAAAAASPHGFHHHHHHHHHNNHHSAYGI